MFEDEHAIFPIKKRVVKKVLESSSSTSSSAGSILTRGDSETSTEGNAITHSPLLRACAMDGGSVKEEMGMETGPSEESTRLLSQALGFSSHNLPPFTSPLMPSALGTGLFPHWWMMPTLPGAAEADGGGDSFQQRPHPG